MELRVNCLGRTREVEVLDDGRKITQMPRLHRQALAIRAMTAFALPYRREKLGGHCASRFGRTTRRHGRGLLD